MSWACACEYGANYDLSGYCLVVWAAPWAVGGKATGEMEAPMRAPWAKAAPGIAPGAATSHPGLRGMGPPGATHGAPPSTFEWKGWTFNAPKGPILATADADTWTTKLGMTLPEMVFGETKLEVKNAAQGLELAFHAYEALDACIRQVDVQVIKCLFGIISFDSAFRHPCCEIVLHVLANSGRAAAKGL